jgi:hypothetical protein
MECAMLEHSRGLALGANASGRTASALQQTMETAQIALSVDPAVPGGLLSARVLLSTLRRMPSRLVLEADGLRTGEVDELAAAVTAIDPKRPLRIGRASDPTVRLHIGTGLADQAIRLFPDGHGAHVASRRRAVIRPVAAASAIGSICTAALGAAEAFKYTARVQPQRRVLHRHLRFCPVTLSSDLSRAAALSLPGELELTLVGIGAIGTGVVLILSELWSSGLIVVVDYERFKRENRGTYSMGGEAEAASEPEKVALAQAALTGFDVIPFGHPVQELPGAIDAGTVPATATVIAGLDSAEARRATQRLWPERLIDAGTGETMLGLHEHVAGAGPCMMCFFPQERSGPSGASRVSELTGLPVELLAVGERILTSEHLRGVSPAQQELLREQVGKPVCGLARAVGLSTLDSGGFRPSVPFISLQAAALAVGALMAQRPAGQSAPNLVQYDGLFGPQAATLETRAVTRGCYCQTHAKTIEAVQALRLTARP